MTKKKNIILLILSLLFVAVCIYFSVVTKSLKFLPGEYGQKVSQDYRWVLRYLLSSSIGICVASIVNIIFKNKKRDYSESFSNTFDNIICAIIPCILFIISMRFMGFKNVTSFYIFSCMNAILTYIMAIDRKNLCIMEDVSKAYKSINFINTLVMAVSSVFFIDLFVNEMMHIGSGKYYIDEYLLLIVTLIITTIYVFVCVKQKSFDKKYGLFLIPIGVFVIIFAASIYNEYYKMKYGQYSSPEILCYPLIISFVSAKLFIGYQRVMKNLCVTMQNNN